MYTPTRNGGRIVGDRFVLGQWERKESRDRVGKGSTSIQYMRQAIGLKPSATVGQANSQYCQ